MSLKPAEWIGGAVAAFGLAIYILILGLSLMPPMVEAEQAGNVSPWFMTWGMILGAAGIGVLIGIFFVAYGMGKAWAR